MRNEKAWQVVVLCTAVMIGGSSAGARSDADLPPPPPPQQDTASPQGTATGPDHREGEAGERESRAERMRKRMFDELFRDIELTPEQREQVTAALDRGRAAQRAWMQEHRDELRDAMRALREAKQSEDPARIEEAKVQLKTLLQSSPKLDRAVDEVRTVLADEQKVTFNRNVEDLRQRMSERRLRGKHGPSSGGPEDTEGSERRGRREGPPAPSGEAATPPPSEEGRKQAE